MGGGGVGVGGYRDATITTTKLFEPLYLSGRREEGRGGEGQLNGWKMLSMGSLGKVALLSLLLTDMSAHATSSGWAEWRPTRRDHHEQITLVTLISVTVRGIRFD